MSQERTVEDLIAEFIASLDRRDNTKISYAGILGRYAEYLRENNLTKPTEVQIVDYKNNYLGKRVKSATIQKYVVVLHRFYTWCQTHHYYQDNISLALDNVKIERTFTRNPLTVAYNDKIKAYSVYNHSTSSIEIVTKASFMKTHLVVGIYAGSIDKQVDIKNFL